MHLVLLATFLGCGTSEVTTQQASASPPSFLTAARAAIPVPFTGTIVEVLDVPGYTYAHIADQEGRHRWVVSLGKDLTVDSLVDIRPFGELTTFYSKHADRHFDQMVFAIVTTRSL